MAFDPDLERQNLLSAAPVMRTPVLRAAAREWKKAHPRVAYYDVLSLIETLWSGNSLERSLALELLLAYRRNLAELRWEHFDHWSRTLRDWPDTDGLGIYIFGPWVALDVKKRAPLLSRLMRSRHLWQRRLALVATVPLNRGRLCPPIPVQTLALITTARRESDPMIVKSTSWALRELTKRHRARVTAYLCAHGDQLPALALRETRNKLRTGLKSGRLRKIELARIDGAPARESVVADHLRAVGFVDGYKGLTLRA